MSRTVGWLSERCWCIWDSNRAGASGAWKAWLRPTKKPGGEMKHSWVPSWIPSTWRGMVPSWASGKMRTSTSPPVAFPTLSLNISAERCWESFTVTKPHFMS